MSKLFCFCLVALLLMPAAYASESGSDSHFLAYPSEQYADHTTAGILGHVAGVLSGYEFIWKDDKPWVPLPEEWFVLMRGPYGNGPTYGGAGVGRIFDNGIGSDDDYHIDFFNQLILEKSGVMPSQRQIYDLWRDYAVSDWGGGDKAMEIMRKKKIPPPYSGMYEYGNYFHWCTEPYIENETLGMNAPGMPQTAWYLADRFASVTGDFESLDFARFWAVAYAYAYVEKDTKEVLRKASEALLPGSWPRKIYDTCVDLYNKKTPWEDAVKLVDSLRREIYLADNIQCAADVNNGFACLALLYGEGEWLEAVKLASISGYDADCTAATVGGLMGIIVGMDGLPQDVHDLIWQNGDGRYVNDKLFVPHIGGEYPDTQSFSDIVNQYIRNGHAQIIAAGGRVTQDTLFIPVEHDARWQGYQPVSADFESGELNDWTTTGNAIYSVEQGDKAHSGDYYGSIKLPNDGNEAAMMLPLDSLSAGEWYRLSAYIMTTFDGEARLAVADELKTEYVSALNANKGWIYRDLIFQAGSESVMVGLVAAQQPLDRGVTAYIDDMRIERLEPLSRIEVSDDAMEIDRVKSYQASFNILTEEDLALCVPYANSGTTIVYAKVIIDGEYAFDTAFAPTSMNVIRTKNEVRIPVSLNAGMHTLEIQPRQDSVMVFGLSVMNWPKVALNDIIR